MQLKARAPGSLMLLGEHAVLFGKPALVCAVNRFITVSLTPNPAAYDETITINAGDYGYLETMLTEITIQKPFQFVLAAIKQLQPKIKRGFTLTIASEFSDQIGFSSSAATTVATLAVLSTWLDIQMTPLAFLRLGRQVVRDVQGIGSGADIAASIFGGVVSYKTSPLTADKIHNLFPLSVLYSGYKKSTAEVIRHVQQHFAAHPEIMRQLISSIGECAAQGAQLTRKKDWEKLGQVFNIQQGLMEALQVSNDDLRQLIHTLKQNTDIMGAKISGSGLGDCVIGLGRSDVVLQESNKPMAVIPNVAMTLQGVSCEKN